MPDSQLLPPNSLKAALLEGRPQIGLWSALCSNITAEILAGVGFDWIVLDDEHAPNEISSLLVQLQAMNGGTAEPVVRPVWNDPVRMKRILDIGARSLLVPFVQNADQARLAVAATRYPPEGMRGVCVAPRANRYGRVRNYHLNAHKEICLLVQLETRSALQEIEAVCSVEGVDGVFIGPSDLAADLGHLGNPLHPEVQDTIAEACRRITSAGKPPGILTSDADDVTRLFKLGFRFVAVGSDVGILARGAQQLLTRVRENVTPAAPRSSL